MNPEKMVRGKESPPSSWPSPRGKGQDEGELLIFSPNQLRVRGKNIQKKEAEVRTSASLIII
jgi:hypothetical protein